MQNNTDRLAPLIEKLSQGDRIQWVKKVDRKSYDGVIIYVGKCQKNFLVTTVNGDQVAHPEEITGINFNV